MTDDKELLHQVRTLKWAVFALVGLVVIVVLVVVGVVLAKQAHTAAKNKLQQDSSCILDPTTCP